MARAVAAVRAGLRALIDPTRQEDVAIVGEATGEAALRWMHRAMLADRDGRRVLRARPIVRSHTSADTAALAALPPGSLGRVYAEHMLREHITADSRAPVRLVADLDLAYVMRRYREVHDFMHVLTGLPISVEGEIALKAYEAVQTGLPMAALAVLLGPVRLNGSARARLATVYLPWALQAGASSRFFLNVFFEQHLARPLDDVRRDMRLTPAPPLSQDT
eukprot:Unigene594_Nuclearia_a/m.1913 Unigene594_Nuclearia_a/g.1913  ORF Unigene594_Nuclearia_a/g.1913 Unigene594_Nuclearia_a/m.1913 type:complete len:220 (-) Unigene594_Nuclearia_a:21-680(-)